MDYSNLPLIQAMRAKLTYTSARAGVLAQNIANADTPNYRARDVKQPDFKSVVAAQHGLQMTATSPKHIMPKVGGGSYNAYERDSTYELSPTGNNVVVEEEMQRVAQNQGEYQRTLNLYRKTLMMFKTVLGNPSAGG
jgi:flagellar basal-body rod protein FlgB